MAARQRRPPQLVPASGTDVGPVRRHAGIGSVAVFDLDRTLLPGSSLVALGRAMAAAGLVTRRRLALAALQDARFRRRGAADDEVDDLRDEALAHVAGLPRDELAALARGVADELVASVSPAAHFLVDRHRAAGDFVVVLSASPQELVEAVVAGIGAHRGVGTRAEVVDGAYTGRLDGPFCYGAGKLERLAADVGPGRPRLGHCLRRQRLGSAPPAGLRPPGGRQPRPPPPRRRPRRALARAGAPMTLNF